MFQFNPFIGINGSPLHSRGDTLENIMRFSSELKETTNRYCREFNRTSPLFKLGREGKVTHFHLATYVVNLEELFRQNGHTLKSACELYSPNKTLSDFFLKKWKEENGHDAWARADSTALSQSVTFSKKPEVLKEMTDLVAFLHDTMTYSPYRYIAYLFFAEHMTSILGPIWMDLLQKNLGSKNLPVTSLSKHIELDGDHAEEMGEFIDGLELSDKVQKDVLLFISNLYQKYFTFFKSLAELTHDNESDTYQKTSRSTLTTV